MKNAIILCSGGLDSVIAAYHAKNSLKYKKLVLFFCNYKQRAYAAEKSAVKYFSRLLKAKFVEADVSWLDSVSTSLINSDKKPKKTKSLRDTKKDSSNWYVPCRNLVFLSCALAYAESEFIKNRSKFDIITGFKNDGAETFPDTTQDFANKLSKISRSTTSVRSEILAPLIKMDKEDIILLGIKYKIPLEKTFSCYVGPNRHCGVCLACKLRKAGFYWANKKDKTIYKDS